MIKWSNNKHTHVCDNVACDCMIFFFIVLGRLKIRSGGQSDYDSRSFCHRNYKSRLKDKL